MTFTPEQIALIEQIVDQRLQAQKQSRQRTTKDYHTADDVRDLIIEHLSEFREFVGDGEFPVNVLRFFLRRKAPLRPKDTEMLGDGHKGQMERFAQQVGNAIQPAVWPQSPFEQVRNGTYRFKIADLAAGVVS